MERLAAFLQLEQQFLGALAIRSSAVEVVLFFDSAHTIVQHVAHHTDAAVALTRFVERPDRSSVDTPVALLDSPLGVEGIVRDVSKTLFFAASALLARTPSELLVSACVPPAKLLLSNGLHSDVYSLLVAGRSLAFFRTRCLDILPAAHVYPSGSRHRAGVAPSAGRRASLILIYILIRHFLFSIPKDLVMICRIPRSSSHFLS